jgi:hypothetical protein
MVSINKRTCHTSSAICCVVTSIVLFVTLLSLTVLREVVQTDYAIEYNTYNCKFGRVLEQGKYTTDVGVELLTFKRTLQDLNLGDLTCMTSDKVLVTLDITMQIQYQQSALIPTILKKFNGNDNYLSFLTALAQSSVLNTCVLYSAEQYYSERSTIDIEMTKNVQKTITEEIGSTVEFFQLKNIQFPSNYSDIVLQKQTTEQLQTTYRNDRENQLTVANTHYYIANNTAEIIIINANQQALTILNQANATKQVVESFWDNRAKVYLSLLQDNFNYNVSALVNYINSETIRNTGKLYSIKN